MVFLDEFRQRARHTAAPLLIACVVAYFGYHAVQGRRGVIAWLQLGQQIEQTSADLVLSRAEERRLARRVALVRSESLDPDLLDERARAVLNLAHPDDLVIVAPAN